MSKTYPSSDEAWENRLLGLDEDSVEAVDVDTENAIDDAACTQLISIRMQKPLIEDMKLIASLNGTIGYQTLMKQILQRFVDAEKKRLFRMLAAEKLAETEAPNKPKGKQRKSA